MDRVCQTAEWRMAGKITRRPMKCSCKARHTCSRFGPTLGWEPVGRVYEGQSGFASRQLAKIGNVHDSLKSGLKMFHG